MSTEWNSVQIKVDNSGCAFFLVKTETDDLFSTIIELMETEYLNLIKAMNSKDFETIWRIGRTLTGQGHAYGLKALTTFGKLIELEAQYRHESELRYTIIGFSNFINKLRLDSY